MKPIKLVMSAFGPYSGLTEIDFENSIGSEGLFLVTGDTGSGKTMIFDAMSYALYGEASGGNGRRLVKYLRSDYVGPDVDTYVEFTFEHRGARYTINRNPEYIRNSRRGEGLAKQDSSATLTNHETGEIISGVEKITPMILDIIGLDREQFSQTSMIAQGDFLKILNSKSDDRKMLFRKIFRTGEFEALEKKLKDLNSEYDSRVRNIDNDILSSMNRVILRTDYTGEDLDKLKEYLSDSKYLDQILDVLPHYNEWLNLEMSNTEKSKRKVEKKVAELNQKYAECKASNEDFEIYDNVKKQLGILLERENKIEDLRIQLDKAIKAASLDTDKILLDKKEEEKKRLTSKLSESEDLVAELVEKQSDAFSESRKASEEYENIKVRYYASINGEIASQLKDGIPCPVCGSTSHPNPAELSEESASQADFEKAEKKRGKAEKALLKADSNLDSEKKKLNELNKEYEKLEKELQKSMSDFEKAVSANGFESIDEYMKSGMDVESVESTRAEISAYEQDRKSYEDQVAALEKKLAGKERIDTADIEVEIEKAQNEYTEEERTLTGYVRETSINNAALDELLEQKKKRNEITDRWTMISHLYSIVSGQKGGNAKLRFEAYVQQYYFRQIIAAANKRLTILTDGMFVLRCKEEAKNLKSQVGLDLDVLDRSTGQWRDVSTLSGGESFMASLALALGMSDVVQSRSGEIRIDSMFIDEGFGSLDENSLRQAVDLLHKLADGNRLIGVISHMPELKDEIDRKIVVSKKISGSQIEVI